MGLSQQEAIDRVLAMMRADVLPVLKARLNARSEATGTTDWPASVSLDAADPRRPKLIAIAESGHRIEIPFDLYPSGWLQ